MATRDKPNSYFAWYNDDDRLAIVEKQLDTTSSKGITSGEYDSFYSGGNLSGTITGVTRSGTTATYTASAVHGLADDDTVSISGTTDYNDADLASQVVDVQSTTTFNMTLSASSGSTESGLSASMVSLFINDGLRITYKSKFEEILVADALTKDLDTDYGLDTSLQPSLVCYVKSRLYEDQGNFEQANYYRQMYEQQMMKQRSRKSGVRSLSVPNI